MQHLADLETGLENEWEEVDCNLIIESKNGLGRLFLGNETASKDFDHLKENSITVVLDMAGLAYPYKKEQMPFFKCIDADDWHDYDISVHFEECFKFIDEHRKNGRGVLVHCIAGISRSSTVIIAYLMKTQNMDLKTAYQFVKKKRGCVAPNKGFIDQLKKFEAQLKA